MRTRRELLFGSGGALATTFAGCTSDPADDESAVFASFFTLAEFTRAVADDRYLVDNAVPVGGQGHGWTPSTDLLPRIVEAGAFVYLGVDGFQPWAEDAVATVEDDYAEGVTLIDVLDGIDLLAYETEANATDGEIGSIGELTIVDRAAGERVGQAHGGHWHGGAPDVPVNEHVSLGATSSMVTIGRFRSVGGTRSPSTPGSKTDPTTRSISRVTGITSTCTGGRSELNESCSSWLKTGRCAGRHHR